ncbi:chromophore lyase CpcT/CpeT [Waterburya agarophytonicola K14]|uniref:Chromophore lyase CpcT/CpeT n=1 Tax=Waterburya agarophytonicola KI4 TaxID=2874699 RepID=A0A964BRF8_9CYAN|nr:chromophore lyase CpcT/CpeT [Waterburya agarophytonicola]MCC0178338.1 chromophore lyase CpcT/CpeT [Waterburya agarophytonicola KI4]
MLTRENHSTKQEEGGLIRELSRLMAGDFCNRQQSDADPKDYAHIRIFFRPLPWDFFAGIGFYSEQVYDYDLWNPYRQGIHRLVDKGDRVYIENYSLKEAENYAGSGHNRDILLTIPPDGIERRYNCSMVFVKEDGMFRGSVEPGNKCFVHRKGVKTYLVSQVELTETTWISWDRGMDLTTGEHIWGSAKGPLKFKKRTSFAEELPLL